MLAVLVASQVASASGLSWTAPAGCPDAAGERARIEQRLGGALDDDTAGKIAIAIEQSGDQLIARVDLRALASDGDVRTLTSTSCDELADAIALIVARAADHAKPPPPAKPPTPAVIERHVSVVAPTITPRRRWAAGARLATVSGVGAMPGVGLGGEAGAFVRRDAVFAELGYTRWLAGAAHAAASDQLEVGLSAVALRVGWRSESARLGAWLVAETGSMTGIGTQAYDDHMLAGRWLAGGAGAGVEWPLARSLGVFGALEVLDAFDRTHFRLDDGTSLYEPKPAVARVSLGAEVTWR